MAILPLEDAVSIEVEKQVTLVIDSLIKHLSLSGDGSGLAPGILQNGCFNGPKLYAERSEMIWSTAYMLFALYDLKTGRVVE